jgi:uncharacterized protein (TIGR02611 family)
MGRGCSIRETFYDAPMTEGPPPASPQPERNGSMVRKTLVLLAGGSVLFVGVLMIVLPGPAFVVIPIGLAILASEFAWAHNLLERLKAEGSKLVSRAGGKKEPRDQPKPPG